MSNTFNCSACGAPLDYDGGPDFTIRCPFCGNSVIVPSELRTGSGPGASTPPQTDATARVLGHLKEFSEIAQLVRDGNKIEAVELYRQATGAGLTEAYEAIEKLAQGKVLEVSNYTIDLTTKSAGPEADEAQAQLKNIERLLRAGNKIEAIKVYRETFGADLVKAKESIDRLETTLDTPGAFDLTPPVVRAQTYTHVSQPDSGRMSCGLVLVIGAIGLVIAGIAVLAFLTDDSSNAIKSALLGTATDTPSPTFTPTDTPSPTTTPAPTPTPGYADPVLEFGQEGTGAGFFEDARSIAVDTAGNIYVGEYDGRVQVFDSQGNFTNQWRVDAVESFLSDLDVDRQGTVYAVYNGQIYRFKGPDGAPLGVVDYEGGQGFQSVGIIPDGGFAAAWNKDWLGGIFTGAWKSQDDIVIFDGEAKVVRVLPQAVSSLSGDSELHTTLAVDKIDEPDIYALAEFNGTMYAITSQGQYYFQIGDDNTRSALDIAADNRGFIYIVSGAGDIAVYDDHLDYVDTIDVDGRAWGIAVNDENEIFVAARTKVIKFALNP